jgi:hypothetical protein
MSAIYCIYGLASFHESLRKYLESVGAVHALESMRRDLTLRSKSREALLTSSRRALIWFADNDVLTVLKKCTEVANISYATVRPKRSLLEDARVNVDAGISQIMGFMRCFQVRST